MAFASGSSLAAAFVTGFIAFLLSMDSTLTPTIICNSIDAMSMYDVISGIPRGTTGLFMNILPSLHSGS